jgi:hypothetical protein
MDQITGYTIGTPIVDDDHVGTVLDITGYETTTDQGIASDYFDLDDNILLVYRARLVDIVNKSDEVGLPRYLQKYLEYGVIANAYRANTDGKIQSLADYWDWRKNIGKEVLLRFRYKRLADRDFAFTGGFSPTRRAHGPRLPSGYPVI